MAGTSLLTLIDDISTMLDDVALMTKVAAKKSAGVLGDDLALNAQQVAGVNADRELPVVWAVAKGSLRNKLILVPAALIVSALVPWMVTPLLMIGGTFLCYEGFEKLAHKFTHSKTEVTEENHNLIKAIADPDVDMVSFEKDKIHGAIRTDFILSAEIIIITLGTVATVSFGERVAVLAGIALIMTVGVYGLVAAIVKLDDGGVRLSRKRGTGLFATIQRAIGASILHTAPYMMKGLSIAGTVAMFMVGGGIIAHGIPGVRGLIDAAADSAAAVPGIGRSLAVAAPALLNAATGLLIGAAALTLVFIAGFVSRSLRSGQA